MLIGFSAVLFETFFQLDLNTRTRGHTAKIKKNRCRTDLRKHYSERVVTRWNSMKELNYPNKNHQLFQKALGQKKSTRMDLFVD